MDTYSVVHEHRFGVSTFLVQCEECPSNAVVIKALDLDFEESRGENLAIDMIDIANMVTIPADNIHVGPVKEHRKYKGKYYELYITGETLEVCPTDYAKEYLVFTASQSEEMVKELEEIINELRGI